jgi:hypothetical protein
VKGSPLPPPRWDTVNAALRAAAGGAEPGLTFVDLSEHETSLGWSEVYVRARRAAAALRALGLRPADRVSKTLVPPSRVNALWIAGEVVKSAWHSRG